MRTPLMFQPMGISGGTNRGCLVTVTKVFNTLLTQPSVPQVLPCYPNPVLRDFEDHVKKKKIFKSFWKMSSHFVHFCNVNKPLQEI